MKRNSKLSLALHALGHMAMAPGEPMRSEDIAAHNGTNAVVVRRVLGQLRRAEILQSARGHAGGWRLARLADRITMADVYRAIGEPYFDRSAEYGPVQTTCLIERTLHRSMNEALADAEERLLTRLAAVTIADRSSAMRTGAGPGTADGSSSA